MHIYKIQTRHLSNITYWGIAQENTIKIKEIINISFLPTINVISYRVRNASVQNVFLCRGDHSRKWKLLAREVILIYKNLVEAMFWFRFVQHWFDGSLPSWQISWFKSILKVTYWVRTFLHFVFDTGRYWEPSKNQSSFYTFSKLRVKLTIEIRSSSQEQSYNFDNR